MVSPSLRHQARQAAGFVRGADIAVTIVAGPHPGRVARAVRAASAGLGRYFPGIEAVIAVCGSAGIRIPAVASDVLQLPGQDALRLSIELADALPAKALVILDAEAAMPESIDSLVRPVLFARQDLAAPVYRDARGAGLLSTLTLHPMMHCLYGRSVRNPAPGEFAMSGALTAFLARSDGWSGEPARRAPSLWAVSEAAHGGFRICDTVIPARPPAVRGAAGQVAGLLSLIAARNGDPPRPVESPEQFGSLPESSEGRDEVRASRLAAQFLRVRSDLEPVWRTFLRKDTVDRLMCPGAQGAVCLNDGLWAHVLFELAEAFREKSWFGPPALETFPVLFGARAAAYHGGIGTGIERSCQVFEAVRSRFDGIQVKGEPLPCLN